MSRLHRYLIVISLLLVGAFSSSAFAQSCPCTIWGTSAAPGTQDSGEGTPIEVGIKFRADADGLVTGVRFYKSALNTGTHIGNLWSSAGTLLASTTFTAESGSGWQQANFSSPVAIVAGNTYVVSYFAPAGHYSYDPGYFSAAGVDNPPLHALANGVDGGNAVYTYSGASAFPSSTFGAANYWVDVVYSPTGTVQGPSVTSFSPANGLQAVSTATAVTVTFSKALDQSTLNNTTFQLLDGANNPVSATITYNSTTRTATLQPTTALLSSTNYTAVVVGGSTEPRIKDTTGLALAANVSWSFQTTNPNGVCPCTIWPSTATPAIIDSGDPGTAEFGIRFRSDQDGYITGIRFYKSQLNAGTHIGNLWTNTGTLLATATFTNESSSGWQQVNFASPVPITAGTTYVASYFGPTGHYSFDINYFATASVDNAPLRALADNTDGRNGVYTYSAASSFPVNTWFASNYWVDVVFNTVGASQSPLVTTFTPSNGASGVSLSTAVTATFNTAMDPSTINSATFQLLDPAHTVVQASVSYGSANNTATLQPTNPLATGMNYTVVLRGGSIRSTSGSALAANVTWSFGTGAATQPPVVISFTPASGATGISPSTSVTATFSKPINATTITSATFQLSGPSSIQVNATLTYNPSTLTATLQPSAALAYATTYTVLLSTGGVKDTSGVGLGSNVTWTFTTASAPPPPPGNCPCTIWTSNSMPTVVDSGESAGVELGLKFRPDSNGVITGIRYYKSTLNGGVHVGSLWTSAGALLATATFVNESSSGWQQVNFSNPVSVTGGSTYVASYFTSQGHYAFDQTYFAINSVDNGPLHAPASPAAGGNGVFAYGTASTFPTQSSNATNYWVDVVYVPNNAAAKPTIIATTPVGGSISAGVGASVTATFNIAMDPLSINGTTFQLVDSSNNVIPGTVNYVSASSTLTFTPSTGLLFQTSYTATVKGIVRDVLGNTMSTDFVWTFTTVNVPAPTGPGGPILVITSAQNPFTQYLGEILLNEGLNHYSMQDIAAITSSTLAPYDLVILGDIQLSPAQVSMLTSWVTAGGRLIAMHPDKQLAGLLGLTATSNTLSNAYLAVNTATGPGVGIVAGTIQFHGSADLYLLNGATSLGTLYTNATAASTSPAVTLANVGSGQAAAFTYDLARSVVLTRQGNPAWSGQDRDGIIDPAIGNHQIRSNDLFFGNASFDPQPDWVDLNKVTIPQADEQQRLLANLILQMNTSKKPLPRFWYFPSGFKAVVIMTGDDHYPFTGSTANRFDHYVQQSASGCSVADWTCIRATSYLWPSGSFPNYQSYVSQGFELANHTDNSPSCTTFTEGSLEAAITYQLGVMATNYAGIPASQTNRTHCVLWSDFDTAPKVLARHGIRLDTSYYFWPAEWVLDRPGMFTGSGMPMRFADRNGNLIDVYQATTQMPDETSQTFPMTINTLLDNAVGPNGFYGAFTTNFHMDNLVNGMDLSDTVVASAQARGVPVISALQMLTWLDGRNSSSFGSLTWSGNQLTFSISVGTGARNIQAMLPMSSNAGTLGRILLNGAPVTFTTQTIKGVQYAFFGASPGSYQAYYGYSVAGSISGAGGNAATLSITGPTTATVTANSSGSYSIGGLAAGSYTITPSKLGYAFAPTSRTVVITNANVTGQNFTATGVPLASLSPSLLNFGGQQLNVTSSAQTVQLTNNGGAAMTIGSTTISGVNASEFTRTTNCGATLAAGSSCSINITFRPTALGARSAQLSVVDNAAGSPHTVALSGTGANPVASLSPTSVAFGNQAVNSTSSASLVTLTNTGGAAMTISSTSIGGTNFSNFSRTTTCGSTLAAGASCTFSITFTPSATGARTGTLSIVDSASGSPHTVVLTGTGVTPTVGLSPTSIAFGNQALNTTGNPSVATLTNTGVVPVTINGITISGTNANNFSYTTTCQSTLSVGANCTISIMFTPSATGSRSATLTISDNATGSASTISLSGTGIGPTATISPASVSFGARAINTTTSPSTVTLTNTGNQAMAISSVTIAGTNPGDFAFTTTCGASLNASASCTISVTFTPAAGGSRSASISVADNAPGSPHTVALSGTGTSVSVSPTSVAFGNQRINTTSSARTVTLRNLGTTTLTGVAISVTGTNASNFAQTNNCGSSLTAGASCTISVTFRPTSLGSRSGTLQIVNSDPTSPQQVSLTGSGTLF